MNDDELKPIQDDDEEEIDSPDDADELDEDILIGKKKKPNNDEFEDLDSLAEEEDEVLPEDSYDDVDLW